MNRIAGVVVLYHPEDEVVACVRSYVADLETLFVIDNSESSNPRVTDALRGMDGVVYVPLGRNEGMATALNRGASLAIQHGFDHVLLMDQDSIAGPGFLEAFREYLSRHSESDIGLLAANCQFKNFEQRTTEGEGEIPVAITAGTVLNLKAFRAVGPFMDRLFIDLVDFEYSLRLRSRGYRVMRVAGATLYQSLGRLVPRRILFKTVAVYHHSPTRVYYRVRNSLAVARMYVGTYPGWSFRELVVTINAVIKIVLFENEKREKLRMAWMGFLHCVQGRGGSYGEALNGSVRMFPV